MCSRNKTCSQVDFSCCWFAEPSRQAPSRISESGWRLDGAPRRRSPRAPRGRPNGRALLERRRRHSACADASSWSFWIVRPPARCLCRPWADPNLLFTPVFRPVEPVGANHLSPNSADHTRTKSLDHPCVRILVRNGIWRLEPDMARCLEAMARVVFRMSEDEHQIHARFRQTLQPSFNKLAANSLLLSLGYHGQRGQDRSRYRISGLVKARCGKQNMANGPTVYESKQRQGRSCARVFQ